MDSPAPAESTPPAASSSRRSASATTPRRPSSSRRKRSHASESPFFGDESKPDVGDGPEQSPSQRRGANSGEQDTPGKRKRSRIQRGYADPSVYAHLEGLRDFLRPGLDLVTIGINPGVESARTGCHYASPTNHYWKTLASAGFTPERFHPSEGARLMDLGIGMTNLVPRPTAEETELSATEKRACVPLLLRKLVDNKPRCACFVGMGIAEHVMAFLRRHAEQHGLIAKAKKPKNVIGIQPFKLTYEDDCGARREVLFFTSPSSSARVVNFQLPDKVKIWTELRELVDKLKCGEDVDTTSSTAIPISSLLEAGLNADADVVESRLAESREVELITLDSLQAQARGNETRIKAESDVALSD